jgi:hypothetical protein
MSVRWPLASASRKSSGEGLFIAVPAAHHCKPLHLPRIQKVEAAKARKRLGSAMSGIHPSTNPLAREEYSLAVLR